MQVVCVQCHAIVVVEDVASASQGGQAPCARCGAAIDLQAAVPESGETAWLIQTAAGHAGPYSANDLARMFDDGSADWRSLVWRAGLKDWRAARRDPELVTALASVRGGGESLDTQRVAEHMSLLPESEAAASPALPDLAYASSVAPLAAPAAPLQRLESGLAEPTFADVLRSAPSILAALPTLEPAHARADARRAAARQSWLPSARSMLLVAILAFASGVLVAAFWGQVLERQPARASTILVTAAPRARELLVQPAPPSAAGPTLQAEAAVPLGVGAPTAAAPQAAAPAPAVQPIAASPEAPAGPLAAAEAPAPASAVPAVDANALRELPAPGELAREFKRVSPEVRRCVGTPARSVDVEVFFAGASGQVAGVNLHTSRLTPGEVECITQALRQLQVAPFRSLEHKLSHRFAF